MSTEFAIVDLFAGPGGLAEGFSSIRNKDGSRPFRIALSVEKEASAFETLRLRSFFRQFNGDAPIEYYRFLNGETPEPDWESLFPIEWKRACLETLKLELGSTAATQEIDARLALITKSNRGCPDGQITCQPPFAKIFLFIRSPTQAYIPPRPAPQEGRSRDRHERGAGCGGRGSVRRGR